MKTLFLFLFLTTIPVFTHANIIISEVAWMGNNEHHSNEWIELYNNGTGSIDLAGWELVATDGTPTITLEGSIGAEQTFILERTDDNTLPGVSANMFYTGALSNSGEELVLKNNGTGVFTISAQNGWPAGDNDTKETMQLINGLWVTKKATPGSVAASSQQSEPEPEPKEEENVVQKEPSQNKEVESVSEEDFVPGPYAQIKNDTDAEKKKPEETNNEILALKEYIEELEQVVKDVEQKPVQQVAATEDPAIQDEADTEKEQEEEVEDSVRSATRSDQEAQVLNTVTIEKPTHPVIELLLFPVKIFQFIKSLFVG